MLSKVDSEADWWRQAVIYQIYPRSFADANGDGIGDFKGVTSKIPYLASLGIDAVWLSPFYPSALKDGGYDVADYRDVDPKIGTLEDFDEMMAGLKQNGIKVIVDIVPNHTSDDHVWFQAALKSPKGSEERDKYIFRDGLGPNKDTPPTDWHSIFGGSCWSPSGCNDGQFYFHMFDSSQPDLNWENEEVKEDFKTTFRFWADRGVSGFRIDVAHGMAKDLSEPLPNWEQLVKMNRQKVQSGNADLMHPLIDRDEVQDIYRSWRKVFNEYDPPLTAVAECWVAPDRKHLYAAADGLGQAFSFDILLCNFNAEEYRKCIKDTLGNPEITSSSTWVLSNHDVIRHATRYGMPDLVENDNHRGVILQCNDWLQKKLANLDADAGLRRARAASLMLLGLPGSTYIYQGEELGLQEVIEIPSKQRQDPSFFRTHGEEVGRDGCRVPLPWTAEAKNFGNGSGAPPHLPQPQWMAQNAVDKLDKTPDSTLNLYRQAIHLRKDLQTFETIDWVDSDANVVHFIRPGGWEIVLNTGKQPVPLPKGKVLINSSMHELGGELPGETCVWLQV